MSDDESASVTAAGWVGGRGRLARRQRARRLVNLVTLATPLGLALAHYGRAELHAGPDGLLLACDYRGCVPAPRAAAITVGDVVLLRMPVEQALRRPRLLAHESRHATQWACWLGPWGFLPAYAAASLRSLVRAGDAATANVFEVHAGLEDGGYSPSRRPPR
ncbi:MAG: hypothetical protein ACLGIA_04245 [Actinomycetes bacterium]